MNKDQKLIGKYMLMILDANNAEPVKSIEHLEAMLFILAKATPKSGLMEAMERERIRNEKKRSKKG